MRTDLPIKKFLKLLEGLTPLKDGFDLLGDHVIITDENANILYANKAVERNTGFPLSESLGKNPGDLWGGKMPKEFYEKVWQTIKIEKKPFVGEVENKRKDGTAYWQEIHISPVLDENGEVKFFIGIEPNITDRKKRDQFKEQFISALSHQLRNPLQSIHWVLENLIIGSTQDKEQLEAAYRDNKILSDLIKNLLVLAQVEKGPLESETVMLDEELQKSIALVQERRPGIKFSFENEAGPVQLAMIKALALQVFLNIMYNASEHAAKEVVIRLRKTEQGIEFSSTNDGPPIPADFQPQIFTKVSSKTGAGLGLFIVKMIADFLGWRVFFETSPEKTAFFVIIPPQK